MVRPYSTTKPARWCEVGPSGLQAFVSSCPAWDALDDGGRTRQRRRRHGAHDFPHVGNRQPVALAGDLKDQDFAEVMVHLRIPFVPVPSLFPVHPDMLDALA